MEVDNASLKVKREQSENLLNESNGDLKKLVAPLDDFSLHHDKILEAHIERDDWIAIASISANAYLEHVLETVEVDTNLNSKKLDETLGTMKSPKLALNR